MLIMTIQLNTPADLTIGVKEDIISYVERYGDARVVSVEQKPQARMEQIMIGGKSYVEKPMSRMRR